MTPVDKLLEMFDNLDAFEAQDLMRELGMRGYELKINRELETQFKKEEIAEGDFMLYLSDYSSDDYKIMVIKLIRNLWSDYGKGKKLKNGIKDFGLKESKNFIEEPKLWPTTPLLIGPKKQLTRVIDDIEDDFERWVTFGIKKYDENYNYT